MSETQLLEHQIQGQQSQKAPGTHEEGPVCPLTGSRRIQVLEEFPTSLLVDDYQRDLGINVASEFRGIERLQLCRSPDSQLTFFYPAVTGSSIFYTSLQGFDWYYPASKFEYQRAASWIKPGDRVLDIGCGAAQFADYIPDASYLGLEPHRMSGTNSMPMGSPVLSENVTWHAMTHSQTYDVVCALQVLEHIGDPRTFLTAALTCLKPEGLLIIGVPSADSYITKIPNFVLNAPPHHLTWWTDEALCHLADQFQLSILEMTHALVESWETRLYWMQRITSLFSLHTSSHFTSSPSRRLLNLVAYLVAGYLQRHVKPPVNARGSSMVMIAKKGPSSYTLSHR
jgi:SAM-dependent methyltransferase